MTVSEVICDLTDAYVAEHRAGTKQGLSLEPRQARVSARSSDRLRQDCLQDYP